MDHPFNTNQDLINPGQNLKNAPLFLRYGKKKFDYPNPKNMYETDFKKECDKKTKVAV